MKTNYLNERLKNCGLSEKDVKITVNNLEGIPQSYSYFSSDDKDNIRIQYFAPWGVISTWLDNKKEKPFYRTRLKTPLNGIKYKQPQGSGNFSFIPPHIIKKYGSKTVIDTLFITEGEFKAFTASIKLGIDIIGIGGIHNFREKDTNQLDEYILKIIDSCKVKNVVLLFDADCLQVEYKPNKDLYARPNNFFTAVKNFKELCKPLNVDVYFSHILESWNHRAKGIDDLIMYPKVNREKLKQELTSFTTGNEKEREFIHCISISENSISRLRQYFAIDGDTPENFYKKYQGILQEREFLYNGDKWVHDGDKLRVSWYGKAENFIRVADIYFKKVIIQNAHREKEETLIQYKVTEITRDYSKEFISHIPKFDEFCNHPDNTEKYSRVHVAQMNNIRSVLYNLFNPLNHELKEGEWKTIEVFLTHIFSYKNIQGESLYNFGLDYIQLLYTDPVQRLPVVCLVSKERNTGKSTFLEFLRLIFKENACILDNQRFTGKFSSHYVGKLIISVDEGFIPVEQKLMKEHIKNLATGKTQWLEAKGQNARAIDYYGKLILCSNEENNFMQIDEGENRFAVIKVLPLQKDDPGILDKMNPEIPHFLHWLKNRKLHYEKDKSRLSFSPEIYKTDLVQDVIERTGSSFEREIREWIRDYIINSRHLQVRLTVNDITWDLNQFSGRKITSMQVRDYLKYKMGLKVSNFAQRYKKYLLTDDSQVSEINKSGRIFKFFASDWLTEDEMKECTWIDVDEDLPF